MKINKIFFQFSTPKVLWTSSFQTLSQRNVPLCIQIHLVVTTSCLFIDRNEIWRVVSKIWWVMMHEGWENLGEICSLLNRPNNWADESWGNSKRFLLRLSVIPGSTVCQMGETNPKLTLISLNDRFFEQCRNSNHFFWNQIGRDTV